MILGGGAKNVLQRIVAWGDGWLPNRVTPDDVRGRPARRSTASRRPRAATPRPSPSRSTASRPTATCPAASSTRAPNRVIVRPPTAETEKAMGEELERIAASVLR